MSKPDVSTLPAFQQAYIAFTKERDPVSALRESLNTFTQLVKEIPEERGEFRYAPGKWTIKEVLCHLMDAERIFTYRALRFARGDQTPLPGFEENDYGPEANAHSRTLQELLDEQGHLRSATLDLYRSFTDEMLQRSGPANGVNISVIQLAYLISGHMRHHINILRERYL